MQTGSSTVFNLGATECAALHVPLALVFLVALVFATTVILAAVGTPWETLLGCGITLAGLPDRVHTYTIYLSSHCHNI